MHGDEAVHAIKLHTLWETGSYVYDPNEYHGPTLYYLTLPILKLAGCRSFADFTETQLRLLPAILGALLVPLLWLLREVLGGWGMLTAGAMTATLTAMVFYSRYYIQETLLVFFTFLLIASAWRSLHTRRLGWAVLAGAGAGMMHATKETCLIQFGCLGAAACIARVWLGREQRSSTRPGPRTGSSVMRMFTVALAAALVVSVSFYSAFFTEWRGPLDSILTYQTYFDRAGSYGLHDHPWHYYLAILLRHQAAPGPVWTEAPILGLFLVGAVLTLFLKPRSWCPPPPALFIQGPRAEVESGAGTGPANQQAKEDPTTVRSFRRFLVLYTLLLTVAYCAIPYKTPWCLLGFLHGMVLTAGAGVEVIRERWGRAGRRKRVFGVCAVLVLGASCGRLAAQSIRSNGRFRADNRNPYVYAHPVGDLLNMIGFVERLAAVHPAGRGMTIQIASPGSDYWPLPWYLRAYVNVGYWDDLPAAIEAPVLILDSRLLVPLKSRNPGWEHVFLYGSRPDVRLAVCVEESLWERFVRSAATPVASGAKD